MSFRTSTRFFAAGAALAVGALAASVAEDLSAAPPAMPVPLARDEEFVVRLWQPVAFRQVATGNLRVTQTPGTSDAHGTWVPGRALVDPETNRAVVVRPEAIRDYYQVVKGLPRADAEIAEKRLLARVERTGNLRLLHDVDMGLHLSLGPNAGTRLDDPNVYAVYPAPGFGGGGLPAYRRLVAGDDEMWHAYLVGGDVSKFAALAQNPEFERFYHPVDVSTGIPDTTSVLRRREYRRVLIRRSSSFFTFMPAIPNQADLADAGFTAGSVYGVSARGPLRGKVKTLLPARGGVLRFVNSVATFATESDPGDGGPFLGGTPWTGAAAVDRSRVVNVTPPDGESDVDPTTDWEDPDNQYTTPLPQRRPFVIRLRFSAPLDPRTVGGSRVRLTKTAVIDSFGNATPVHVPVAVGVFLAQTRDGEIRVDVTPAAKLDPGGRYEVVASGAMQALSGRPLSVDYTTSFETAH